MAKLAIIWAIVKAVFSVSLPLGMTIILASGVRGLVNDSDAAIGAVVFNFIFLLPLNAAVGFWVSQKLFQSLEWKYGLAALVPIAIYTIGIGGPEWWSILIVCPIAFACFVGSGNGLSPTSD